MNKKDYQISSRFDALNDFDIRSDESNQANGVEMIKENIYEDLFYSDNIESESKEDSVHNKQSRLEKQVSNAKVKSSKRIDDFNPLEQS